MAKTERGLVDKAAARLRELLNDLDRLIQPQPQKPARVPVPVPVRPNPERRPRPHDPWRR